MNTRTLNLAAFSAAAILVGLVVAGPITPAPGPVGATMKTLTEVEPRALLTASAFPGDADSLIKITQSGSYYLAADIVGVSGKHGIEIAAANVTIDLNGFQVRGVPGSLTGVMVALPGASDITLRNGSINGWGGNGYDGVTFNSLRTRLTGVNATDNAVNGFRVYRHSEVVDCNADENGARGFDMFSYCVVSHCQANNNGENGIDTGAANSVTNCVVYGNMGAGIHSTGGLITGCVAANNHTAGIHATNNCLIKDNNCLNNSFAADVAGILVAGGDCRVDGNTCSGNGRGVSVQGAGNIIVRTTCAGNILNWSIAANNVFGAIIDRTVPASGAVSGNSAASTLTSTDANANFTF